MVQHQLAKLKYLPKLLVQAFLHRLDFGRCHFFLGKVENFFAEQLEDVHVVLAQSLAGVGAAH